MIKLVRSIKIYNDQSTPATIMQAEMFMGRRNRATQSARRGIDERGVLRARGFKTIVRCLCDAPRKYVAARQPVIIPRRVL